MTTEAHGHSHDSAHAGHGEHEHVHPVSYYVKTWALLLGLLVVSFVGPIVAPHIFGEGTHAKTVMVLLTAFGIAIVKAYYVCARFMHLNTEKSIASMIVFVAVVLMGLFFFGVAPDVMKHEGQRWVNVAAKAETKRRAEKEGEHGEKLEAQIKAHEEGKHEGGSKAHEGSAKE